MALNNLENACWQQSEKLQLPFAFIVHLTRRLREIHDFGCRCREADAKTQLKNQGSCNECKFADGNAASLVTQAAS